MDSQRGFINKWLILTFLLIVVIGLVGLRVYKQKQAERTRIQTIDCASQGESADGSRPHIDPPPECYYRSWETR